MGNEKQVRSQNQKLILTLAFVIIGLLAVIVVIITGGISMKTTQTLNTTMTQTIETKDGKPRNLKVTYSVGLEGNDISRAEVKETIKETMSTYSYEEMTSGDAVERLKRDVHRNLEEVVGVGNVGDIYISDFNANASAKDVPVQDSEWIERRKGIMQGIFPKYNGGN